MKENRFSNESKSGFLYICYHIAQLAELVDALVSGTSVLLDVGVRVPYWAHSIQYNYSEIKTGP